MSGEQRLIRMKQSVESGLPVGLKGVVVSEQQKAIAFERLLSEVVQFFLLLPAEFVQRLVHEPHYVEAVKDNVRSREALAHGRVVTAAHVHGHSLKAFGFAGQCLQKGADVLLAFSFNGMEDSPSLQVGNHGHVLMALPEAEFVDSDLSDFPQRKGSVKKRESFLMDLLDHVPSHSKVLGDSPNGAELQKIQDGKRKRPNVATVPAHEGKMLPPEIAAFPASEPVQQQIQKTPFASHGTHPEQPSLVSFESDALFSTAGTLEELVSRPGAEKNAVPEVAKRFMVDTFQPESMVEYGCGHG